MRPVSSSARPERVTRKTIPIAIASATVIQPFVHTAPPMVFAAGDRPVMARMPGLADSAANSSSEACVVKVCL